MALKIKWKHLPQRVAAGAFILNSGIGKWSADEETAKQLHGFAVGTYPFLAKLKPEDFVKLLAGTEIALGLALLVPVVPAAVAGAGTDRVLRRAARPVRPDARYAPGRHPPSDPAGHPAGQGRVDGRDRPRAWSLTILRIATD